MLGIASFSSIYVAKIEDNRRHMPEQENNSFKDIFGDGDLYKLKSVDICTLEKAITKAVGDIVGVDITCSINNIVYRHSVGFGAGVKFNVDISGPSALLRDAEERRTKLIRNE